MRGVIDAIADQHHLGSVGFEFTHGVNFVLREQPGADIGDTHVSGECGSGPRVVAGEQNRARPSQRNQAGHRVRRTLAYPVGEAEYTSHDSVDADDDRGVTGLFKFTHQVKCHGVIRGQQGGFADLDEVSPTWARTPCPGWRQNSQQNPASGRLDAQRNDGAGQRVFGWTLDRGRQREQFGLVNGDAGCSADLCQLR